MTVTLPLSRDVMPTAYSFNRWYLTWMLGISRELAEANWFSNASSIHLMYSSRFRMWISTRSSRRLSPVMR